jgi:GMP synthase-like glutamine amidotransferase
LDVLAVTHGPTVGPESLSDVVAERGDTLIEWRIEERGAPPLEADAVVVLGGHQNVGEESLYPWLEDEYEALRSWVESETPLFGVCLGGQTLAHALGGSVRRRTPQLAGFYETTLTPAGVADPVLGALPERFRAFNGNSYMFEPPLGAVTLADGPVTQAFRVRSSAWGVQFHPELKQWSVETWFAHDPDIARRVDAQRAELETWTPLGTRLFGAFLDEAQRATTQIASPGRS